MTDLHRAEQVMLAVVAAVSGLATTAENVFRGRAYDLAAGELPALLISQGDEDRIATYSHDLEDWLLEVFIEIRVAETATNVETAYNAIRREVSLALAADHTLGLGFVQNIEEVRGAAGDIAGEGSDRPSAAAGMDWQVLYRRSRLDPAN